MTGPGWQPYLASAPQMIVRYDAVDPAVLLAPAIPYLPTARVRVLDVGAGSGRDARWLASLGHAVTAAEPVAAFREHGIALGGVTWVDDHLPELGTFGADARFDLILCIAVWHHLTGPDRDRTLARMDDLLAPGGRIIIALRQGPMPDGPKIHAIDPSEESARAETAGFSVLALAANAADNAGHGPQDVHWVWAILGKGGMA